MYKEAKEVMLITLFTTIKLRNFIKSFYQYTMNLSPRKFLAPYLRRNKRKSCDEVL